MKILNPYKNVIHIKAETQYELTSTFIRMQEFYESPYPEINGHYFTLETYMDRYVKDHNNQFTYFTDWIGFNIPGHVIKKFFDIFQNDLSQKEYKIKEVLDEGNYLGESDEKFYVIGTYGDDVDSHVALSHECAHAFFYLYEEYSCDAIKLYNTLPVNIKEKFKTYLLGIGYMEGVIIDETNAYFSTTNMVELVEMLKLDNEDMPWADVYAFQKLFDVHTEKYKTSII